MTEPLDIEAYFARVGYAGPRAPTLQVLNALHEAHARSIPFENFDVLLHKPVALDLATLQDKLIARRRGGYCFEHNGLFAAVLRALGFSVRGLAARVQWMRPDDAPLGPRTHMLLEVALPEGPYLADVGFGGVTMTAPIRMEPWTEQPTPHESLRLVPVDEDELQLQVALPGGWQAMYRFGVQTQTAADYELANWFTSTHPTSHFRGRLMGGRPGQDGLRHTLRDLTYSIYGPNGLIESRVLTLDELEAVLRDVIGLEWPADRASLEAIHERLKAAMA